MSNPQDEHLMVGRVLMRSIPFDCSQLVVPMILQTTFAQLAYLGNAIHSW
jgi:hypothetical protein